MRILVFCLLAASNAAAVPMVVQHHGRLLDGEDQPVTGSVDFVFTLHEVETDPTLNPPPPVWTRSYTVTVAGGLYSVALGAGGTGDALDSALFDGATPLYMQVKVGGSVLSPRLIVGSVPYAFFTDAAAVAHDLDCAGPCVSGAEIADGTITAGKIADGAGSGLDADKLDGKDSADFVLNTDTPQAGAKFAVQGGSIAGALAVGGAFTASGTVGGAGFSGWDTDDGDDLTVATNFSGDVTGTAGATVVGDDSHGHGDGTVSDNLSIDNGRLYAPAGAGNVGIGTTSPGALLHVNGGSSGIPIRLDGDQAAIHFFNNAGVRKGIIGIRDDISGNTNDKVFHGDAGNWLFTTGNVGIGTTSPSEKLHVAGNILTSGTLTVNGTGTSSLSHAASTLVIGSATSYLTSGPQHSKLEVHDSQATTAVLPRITATAWGDSGSTRAIIGFARSKGTTVGSHSVVSNSLNLGELRWAASDGSVFTDVASITARMASSGVNTSSGPSQLEFYTNPVSGFGNYTLGMTLDKTQSLIVVGALTASGTGDSSFAGNVGIGTTSPRSKLEVNGTIMSANSAGGGAQRAVKVQGASGAFTHLKVTVALHGAGGYVYRIQVGGTGGSQYQTGGGYTNTTPNFSHTTSSGSGFTASTPAADILQLDINISHTHPVCIFEVTGSLSQSFTDSDITITFT